MGPTESEHHGTGSIEELNDLRIRFQALEKENENLKAENKKLKEAFNKAEKDKGKAEKERDELKIFSKGWYK
jgi:regulator of replication initiation timing